MRVTRVWLSVSVAWAVAFMMSVGAREFGQEQLPDGPGKDVTVRICGECHDASAVASQRLTRRGWQDKISEMIDQGAHGTDDEFAAILDYLAIAFTAEETAPRLNMNTATAVQLESVLGLLRKESAAIIGYREKNGKFKSIADLKRVPGVDFKKIEAKHDRLVF